MTMDQVHGSQPTSAPLERDARLVSTDHRVAPSEIAIGVIIGRAAEYFDFFVFAIASVVVFPKVFFPFAEPVTATLYSFAMFSLAFVARPIGSIIFMAIDRRHGRGVKLTIALFLLGFSTMAVSFLPGYAQIGAWSLYLLAILRIGQGLALGGAWDGLASGGRVAGGRISGCRMTGGHSPRRSRSPVVRVVGVAGAGRVDAANATGGRRSRSLTGLG